MVQKRISWLDNTKMVAMICVIIGHTGDLFSNGIPGRLLGLIVAFNMPLFVLLSGLVSLGALYRITNIKSLVDYTEKILWRMIVPAVILSAVEQVLKGMLLSRKLWIIFFCVVFLQWFVFRQPNIKKKLLWLPKSFFSFGNAVIVTFLLVSSLWLNMYWFLSMLMKLQLISACVMLVLNHTQFSCKARILFLFMILWVGTYFLDGGWTFEMSIYFAIGLLLKQFDLVDRICNMQLWVSILLFVIGCILCKRFTINYGFYGSSLQSLLPQGLAYIYVLRVLVALFLSAAIIRWIYALSREYNWFSYAGSRSMAFYTIHALLLATVLEGFYIENPHNYMWIFGFLFAFAFTAVTYGIILLCERCNLTRGLVLGDWK